MLGYRQSLKDEILDLSDHGMGIDAVARQLRCDRHYVQDVVSKNAIDAMAHVKHEKRMQQQSRDFGRALIAAGGHR